MSDSQVLRKKETCDHSKIATMEYSMIGDLAETYHAAAVDMVWIVSDML